MVVVWDRYCHGTQAKLGTPFARMTFSLRVNVAEIVYTGNLGEARDAVFLSRENVATIHVFTGISHAQHHHFNISN